MPKAGKSVSGLTTEEELVDLKRQPKKLVKSVMLASVTFESL